MPWITLTPDHVKARMSQRELATYETVSRAEYLPPDEEEGQGEAVVPADAPERMPQIIEQVCNRFRGAILGNPRVTRIGPPGTLPECCIYSASVLARLALIGMAPVPEGMTDPRREEYRAAEKELEALRSMDPRALDDDSASVSEGGRVGGSPLLEF